MSIKIAKIEQLDLVIATAALNTVIKQTELLQKQGVMDAKTKQDAKRALRETKATYKKLKNILDQMENIGAENVDEVLHNGI